MLYNKNMKRLYLTGFMALIPCLFFAGPLFCENRPQSPAEMQFPVSCRLNENCWVINSDKQGTDIAIKSISQMEKGIPVLSAEHGTVVFVQKDEQNNTKYGNAVIIEHNNEWKTLYGHLKKGSILVKAGDFARKGSQIAELGMSGEVEFPQMHFAVFKDGALSEPLWSPPVKEGLKPVDFAIVNTGISIEKPEPGKIRQGSYNGVEILNDAPFVYLWAYGFNFKEGDFLKFDLYNPGDEKILSEVVKADRDYKEAFFTAGPVPPETGAHRVKTEFIRLGPGLAKEHFFSFNVKEPEKPIDPELLKQREEQKKLKKTRFLKRRRLFIYKKLYDEGKLPETVPEHILERLKGPE